MRTMLETIRRLLMVPLRALAERARTAFEPIVKRVGETIGPAWNTGRTWYNARESREKRLIQILGAVVAVLIAYNIVYMSAVDISEGLHDRVARRRMELLQVRSMMRTWTQLGAEMAAAEKRTIPKSGDFSLFSVVEQSLTKSIGHEKIASITPADKPVPGGYTQYTIDLKLSGLSLAQIVDALYDVQTQSVPVTVSNLHIRQRTPDTHSYDVDMTCAALGKNA
jgi:type II secretory pathway component PulM